MSCAVRDTILPQGRGVRVNGVAIARDLLAREVQNHPARTPAEAWTEAARALVIRELLLQEARRLEIVGEPMSDAEGRRETEDEAAMRALIVREVTTPEPDEESCRRYYEQNRRRFRSPDIYEAAHILFTAAKNEQESYERAHAEACAALELLRVQPEKFAELARLHSACTSAAQGGNLGQITTGQTTPEFEQALTRLAPGTMSEEPVSTRYGFHIIRLERRIEGRELPFEAVADRIAAYLKESVERRALAQYLARLAERAKIEGVTLAGAQELRVH
jgi:peptidyl-prolyl cis-trans isomerase C